jgi:uncharacterized SAM-binding protein YcdF (DUF218 family)
MCRIIQNRIPTSKLRRTKHRPPVGARIIAAPLIPSMSLTGVPQAVTFKAVAIALSVPPTSLAFLAVASLLIEWRHRRLGRFLTWFAVLGLLVVATPAVGLSLLDALEEDLPLDPPPDQPPEAIVILSGDVLRSGRQAVNLRPGPQSFERERAGALLARHTQLPVLVSGGNEHRSEPPVAVLMADSLEQDFQVPVRWIERESRDTWANARMSAAILRDQGIHSAYLVTGAWHMRRAILAFRGMGITVTAAPTYFDRAPGVFATDFVPSVGGWTVSYHALHELIGYVWYAMRSRTDTTRRNRQ